ncbi:Glucose dehydrogenase [acceptor] [Harpegnathos saltator]|uniref:Glucose dehydrogenase [acceptor] n=1 Tax=Harpegnathos saltator TaxID=610380 RepID=E2BJK6_HARSA|nr:Glucose dehydrogenase [acceptor] [Harpegnathos saltator]
MFRRSRSLLHFTSIICVILPFQLGGQTQSTDYQNPYNIFGIPAANLFRLSLGVMNFLNEGQHYLEEQIPEVTPEHEAVYDFVVVGAGTAGATLATRLSEIPHVKVLLIEAGVNENLLMDVPLLVHILQLSDVINWKYQTKPSDKYCLGMNKNSCSWPRGKVMGGSSVLNYMIASRGAAKDYDRWAKMGNDGWAYKDVLKYFKKLETMDIPELRSDTKYHGTNGPVHITYPQTHTLLAEAFLRAGKELGYPLMVDYNSKSTIGFSYLQTTIKNGTRLSSNRAYLSLARFRKNLHVTRESTVKKVLIDRRENKAVGVKFTKGGKTIRVFAKNEVILCAGAIGSPQLLMLSGIGPAEHLAELGIDIVKDAPVGENLMDHIGFGGLVFTVNSTTGIQIADIINPMYSFITDFLMRRSGPVTIPGGCEALAFLDTKHPKKLDGSSDIELIFIGGSYKGDPFLPITTNLDAEMSQIWNKYNRYYGWTIFPILLKPKSRGWIKLLANDINVKPEIVPNYFDNPEDVKTLIAGIRSAIELSRTQAMQEFGSQLTNDTLPGCEKYEYDSDDYWECAIRTVPYTIYHFSGTCKMGPKGDPTAVVDPRLKVNGVQGLRVADASIIPEIVAGHTNLPVYMIAEKLADMIKEEWGYV